MIKRTKEGEGKEEGEGGETQEGERSCLVVHSFEFLEVVHCLFPFLLFFPRKFKGFC